MIKEMGVRVGLPLPLISEIYFLALADALKNGNTKLDMRFMAYSIKYISENTIHLKPRWRNLIPR
jgi:hypothetical protein